MERLHRKGWPEKGAERGVVAERSEFSELQEVKKPSKPEEVSSFFSTTLSLAALAR
jgi:hypothetical protein